MSNRPDRRRTRGIPSLVLAAKTAVGGSTPEGQFGQVIAPTHEAIREAIEAGKCPWCGKGPYRVLALHTNSRHGIDRFELRELGDLPRNASICDPEHSQKTAERQRALAAKLGSVPPWGPGRKGRKLSVPALARQRQSLALRRRPRDPCEVCGGEIPYKPSKPRLKTCSPACLTALRRLKASRPRFSVCKQGHPLEGDNLVVRNRPEGGNPKRLCRICLRARDRAGKRRLKEKAKEGT